jgi:hypothetical protein
MKLSTVSILSAIVIFVANMPHAVGASLLRIPESLTHTVSLQRASVMDHKMLAKATAKRKLNRMFGKRASREFAALSKLWGKESAWNWKAKNPHSSAYGIAQVLGTPKGSTIEYQVNMGIKYIVHRYKTPTNAWKFWKRNGWY